MNSDKFSEQQAAPIRIKIAMPSGLLSEIVIRTLEQQPDMLVQHFVCDLNKLNSVIEDQTDVLILSAPHLYPPPQICRTLWLSNPRLKVFVFTPNGDAAVIYRLHAHRHRLKTVKSSTLVDSIRQAQKLDLAEDRNADARITECRIT